MKKTIFLLVIVLGFSCPSIQAEMSMRIISRNIRSHEEKAVADNEEKKEAAKAVEVEETKEAEEVTESTTAVEAAETSEVTDAADVAPVAGETEIKGALVAVEVAETTEAVGVIEATEVAEVKEPTDVTEATKAVEVAETSEITEVAEVEEVSGITETKEATGVIEAANVEEVKEPTEVTEATKAVEVTEISETTEATETTKPVEVTEVIVPTKTIEAGPVDYEALGLRSVELNPNDYPDEVIALLEPHKNNENNNSVLFYSSLGLAYKSKGRLNAAIVAYKRALKLVQNVPAPSIQYNLGIAYYYNDELHKSFNCFLNSSAQRSNHKGTEKWIKQLADELDIYNVPNTSKLKLVVNQKISVNREKDDRESRIRMYLTQDGGRIQELSVKDKIYSYGIDSDTKRPVDYIIIDNDGDGSFDNVINTKGKFGVPTWAYNPD